MHPPERLEDRLAIEALNNAFCAHLDDDDVPALMALFASDALYVSPTAKCSGAEEIEAYFRKRTEKGPRTSRHFFSNLMIEFTALSTARGKSAVLSFAQDGAPPLPIDPFLIADFRDVYVRDPERGWLIGERLIVPIFKRG